MNIEINKNSSIQSGEKTDLLYWLVLGILIVIIGGIIGWGLLNSIQTTSKNQFFPSISADPSFETEKFK